MENHKGKIPNFGMYTPYKPRDAFSMDDFEIGRIAYRVADESLNNKIDNIDNIDGEFYMLDPFLRGRRVNPSENLYETNTHPEFTETPMGKLRRMIGNFGKHKEEYKPKE